MTADNLSEDQKSYAERIKETANAEQATELFVVLSADLAIVEEEKNQGRIQEIEQYGDDLRVHANKFMSNKERIALWETLKFLKDWYVKKQDFASVSAFRFMEKTYLDNSAIKIIKPVDVLNNRANHRMVGGDKAREEALATVEEKYVSKVGPIPMSEMTHGLEDEEEFVAYIKYFRGMSDQGIFTPEDCSELVSPIADYCDTHSLQEDGVKELRELRLSTRALQAPDAVSADDSESMDRAMVDYVEVQQSKLNEIKGALFTLNIMEVLTNKNTEPDAFMAAMENGNTLGDERDVLIEEHFKTLDKKFNPYRHGQS